jgi:two-component system, OmpR family, heavy metal sensor histidine kinase CusS
VRRLSVIARKLLMLSQADADLVHQILHNLISNAIKYDVQSGWIHIAAPRSANQVFVSVSNASNGIAPGDEGRVFERFCRSDRAHGRAVGGVGPGLTLAREIARGHGGDLTLQVGKDQRAAAGRG